MSQRFAGGGLPAGKALTLIAKAGGLSA